VKIVYGVLTFVLGFILVFVVAGIFSSEGAVQVTNASFNSAMMALCTTILFLCGVIVACTFMIINALKRKK